MNLIVELLVHPDTKKQLANVLTHPSHALMLIAPDGSGKGALAVDLAARLLKLSSAQAVFTHPYVTIMEPVEGVLSIADIRTLQERVRLRTTGKNDTRRVIIIESAHLLTIEAQNAFLKLLEEPPADTVIIMTSAAESRLLPTVYSRVQKIFVHPLPRDTLTTAFVAAGINENKITSAYYLADGRVGLMCALLADDAGHPLAAAITHAKALLGMSVYDRLKATTELSKQKEDLPVLLTALQRIAHAGMHRTNTRKEIAHWHQVLLIVRNSRIALDRNANHKLLLCDLMLNL